MYFRDFAKVCPTRNLRNLIAAHDCAGSFSVRSPLLYDAFRLHRCALVDDVWLGTKTRRPMEGSTHHNALIAVNAPIMRMVYEHVCIFFENKIDLLAGIQSASGHPIVSPFFKFSSCKKVINGSKYSTRGSALISLVPVIFSRASGHGTLDPRANISLLSGNTKCKYKLKLRSDRTLNKGTFCFSSIFWRGVYCKKQLNKGALLTMFR